MWRQLFFGAPVRTCLWREHIAGALPALAETTRSDGREGSVPPEVAALHMLFPTD